MFYRMQAFYYLYSYVLYFFLPDPSMKTSWSPPPASLPDPPRPSSGGRSPNRTLMPSTFDTHQALRLADIDSREDNILPGAFNLRLPQAEAIRQCLLNQKAMDYQSKPADRFSNGIQAPVTNNGPLSNPYLVPMNSASSSLSQFASRLSPNAAQFFPPFTSVHDLDPSFRNSSESPMSSRSSSTAEFPENLPFSVSPPLTNNSNSAFSSRLNLGVSSPANYRDLNTATFGLPRSLIPLGSFSDDQTKPTASILDGQRMVRNNAAGPELTIPSNCSEIMRNMAAKYNFNKTG